MKKHILSLIFLMAVKGLFSQEWKKLWQTPGTNFYDIKKSANKYWAKHREEDEEENEKHANKPEDERYEQYMRWEDFTEPRVYPSGDISLLGNTWANYQAFLNNNSAAKTNSVAQTASTTWQAMGPFGPLTGVADNGLPRKAGRFNFVTFHPTLPNTFWAGSPSGGLWKTTDGGSTWNTTTDNLGVIGCTDLALEPGNPNTMYLSTGDGYSNFNPSIGLYRSTDGGNTWGPTSLTFAPTSTVAMRRVIVNPSNTNIIMVATVNGIYRTTTGPLGAWTKVCGLNTYDLEFKPTDPNTVYASGLSFSVSINGGLTFSQISSGIAVGGGRTEIAVTPANPNYVYVVKSTALEVLQGVYYSNTSGNTFTTVTSAPNLLSSDCVTPGTDGQGNYDLTIAASPLNANEVVIGGITMWKSTSNGTAPWTNIGCGYTAGAIPFIHADHHELEYTSTGTLYDANDGGLCVYTGSAWNDITSPCNIAQIYKIGLSSLSPNLWMSGHQDNGSNIYDNGNYKASLMADGMDCFVDRKNDMNLFASKFQGSFYNSTNGGATWSPCVFGAPGLGAWVSPWKTDPTNTDTIWCGKTKIYKSPIGSGIFWSGILTASFPGVPANTYVKEFAVAPTNNQILYAIHGTTGIFKTVTGATTWTNVSSNLPLGSAALSNLLIHPTNPNIVWVTFSGYSATNKVWKTINGGTTWSSVTVSGLPNIPANCLTYEPGNPNDRIYLGMDVGVYYIDNLSGSWTLYNTGLPNVIISDMEISPAAPNKLRAGTFGRGVYQVDIVPSAAPPVTAFNYVGNSCAPTSTLYMNDNSTNSPTSWSWSVTPATGVTINSPSSQNPTITINNGGIYTISVKPTNGFGSGSVLNQTIAVSAPTINATASSTLLCGSGPVTLNASGAASYTWQPGSIVGATANYTPATTQIYSITASGFNNCISNATLSVIVSTCTGVFQNGSNPLKFIVYPNPANDKLNIYLGTEKTTDLIIEVLDISGKIIIAQPCTYSNENKEQQLNIASLAKGVYLLKLSSKEGVSQTIKFLKE